MSLSTSASQFVLDGPLHIFKTSRSYRDGLVRTCMRADDARVKEFRQRMLDS